MAGRYGGRFGTNQEQEQRRIQKEPVVVWRKEWVLPAGASANAVKVLKWVRTGDVITFDEEEGGVGDETTAMDVDISTFVEPPHTASAIDSQAATPGPAAVTEALGPLPQEAAIEISAVRLPMEVPSLATAATAEGGISPLPPPSTGQSSGEGASAVTPVVPPEEEGAASTAAEMAADEMLAEGDSLQPLTQPSQISSEEPLMSTQGTQEA